MNKYAILILNYNGKHFLENCYNSLLSQSSRDFDLWLIDNNSSDGSREYTERAYPIVNILNTHGNLGYAGAYNFAFEYLINKSYTYYLLLNNDTRSSHNLIEKLIDTFESNPKAGIVVPTIINESRAIDSFGGKFIFLSGTTLNNTNGENFKFDQKTIRCFWASGCALSIRKEVLSKIGYFGDYFIYYEDVDLSWRVNNAGYKVLAIGSAYVEHLQGGAKTPSEKQLYLCERNRVFCYYQNLPLILFLIFLPYLLIFRILLLFYLTSKPIHIRAKIKGLYDGVIGCRAISRNTFPMSNHIKVIRSMLVIAEE